MNTPGGDLIRSTVGICEELEKEVVLFGSSQTNREKSAAALREVFPNLNVRIITGEYDFRSGDDSRYVATQIDKINPSLAIMAGFQTQAEEWINSWLLSDVNVGLVGNFGQTIDVWAEKRWVPPQFAREHGFGWILRLCFDSKQRRTNYARTLLVFGKIALLDAFEEKRRGRSTPY